MKTIGLNVLARKKDTTRNRIYYEIKRAEKYFLENKITQDIRKYYQIITHLQNTKIIIISEKNIDKILNILDICNSKNRKKYIRNRPKTDLFWKDDSIYCYSIGYNCQNCRLAKIFPYLKENCKMNEYTQILLKSIGEPKNV